MEPKPSPLLPAPFWFLNHDLDPAEMSRQIRLMAQAGQGGFFLHTRGGLKTPFGSKRWFDVVRHAVLQAKHHGLEAWLYDEDPYNTGMAGGKVVFDHPEYAARQLIHRVFKPEKDGWIRARWAGSRTLQALALDRGGLEADVASEIGIVRPVMLMSEWNTGYLAGAPAFQHFRSEGFYPEWALDWEVPAGDWELHVVSCDVVRSNYRWGWQPDLLRRGTTEYFISCVHEKYREALGDEFGKTVPGIFMDELSLGSALPWSEGLEPALRRVTGLDPAECYVDLFVDRSPRSAGIREAWWETVEVVLRRNFLSPVSAWCRRHGLLLVGHHLGEEDPAAHIAIGGGDLLRTLRCFDVPGFDLVTTRIGGREFPLYQLGAKLAVSAARHMGKRRILAECFACAPWNYRYDGMKRTVNWLLAQGATWLTPHGFHYSIDAYRRYDAGKGFFFQDPWHDDYVRISRYAAAAGAFMEAGEAEATLAVAHPASAFRRLLPVTATQAQGLRDRLATLTQVLIEAQVAFDFVDEVSLRGARWQGGLLRVGKRRYRALLHPGPVPPGSPLGKRMAQWRRAGNPAFFAASGEDPIPRNLVDFLLPGTVLFAPHALHSDPAFPGLVNGKLAAGDAHSDTRRLMGLVKSLGAEKRAFVFNNHHEAGRYRIEACAGTCFALFDANTGETLAFADPRAPAFHLGPYDAVLLRVTRRPLPCSRDYVPPESFPAFDDEFETQPQWVFEPPQGASATVSEWDASVDDALGRKLSFKRRFSLLRELLGGEGPSAHGPFVRPVFDRAPPPFTPYPVEAVFTAEFRWPAPGHGSAPTREKSRGAADRRAFLVCDGESFAGRWELRLNGKPVPPALFRRHFVYDVENRVADVSRFVRAGHNRVEVRFPAAGAFDGLRGPLYFMDGIQLEANQSACMDPLSRTGAAQASGTGSLPPAGLPR